MKGSGTSYSAETCSLKCNMSVPGISEQWRERFQKFNSRAILFSFFSPSVDSFLKKQTYTSIHRHLLIVRSVRLIRL